MRRTNDSGFCWVGIPKDGREQPELGKGRLRWLGAGENKVEHFHRDKVTVAALIYLRQRPKGRTPRGH